MTRTRGPLSFLCSLAVAGIAALAGIAGTAGIMGCSSDPEPTASCEIYCDRNIECQAEPPTREGCLEICNGLAEDEGYAAALANQSECYKSATCEDIRSNLCDPKDL